MAIDLITLRPAALGDAGAVAGLLVQLYHAEAPGVLRGLGERHTRLFCHLIEYEIARGSGGRYVAADAAGRVVGSASLRSPAVPVEVGLPPGVLGASLSTVGLGDTLRLIGSALRASLTSDVALGRDECYIYSVVVDEVARGRGVGAAMMVQLEELARRQGARTALLRVIVGNATARRLYTRLGYRLLSRTSAFLDPFTFPTELMRKEL
jgi:ribosomal protein S18 acetylase RimI-like enzyme